MSGWTREEPGAGDTAFVRTTAVNLDYLAAGLDQARVAVSSEGEVADADDLWCGAARDAWREQRDRLVTDLGPVVEAMAAYHDSLTAYADAVEDIDAWARQYRQRRADADAELADARREMFTLTVDPVGAFASGSRASSDRVERAEQDIAAVERGLDELESRRRSADRRLLDALVPVSVGEWAGLGQTMSESGFARPDELTGDAVASALVDVLLSIRSGSTDALTQARELLAAWGDGPAVLDALFERLGGAGTAAVVDALGVLVAQGEQEEAASALAVALRAGLARVAGSWDADRVADFADTLMESGRAGGAIVFLFDDWQNPMPEGLTVAMADRVEAFEQAYGSTGWNVEGSGGAALVAALHHDDLRYGTDPAGAVLGTLGQHPDAALDWLDDGRIAYWYGERDGGLPHDGFAGMGALWEGIFHVTGGLDDPETADIETLTRWARTTAAIMTALSGNASYTPGNISPTGAAAVGGAIGEMLPLISQVPLTDWVDGVDPLKVDVITHDAVAYGRDVAFPVYGYGTLARLLGVATTQPTGVLAYGAGVAAAIDRELGALDPTAPTYGEDVAAMLDRVGALLGLAEGAQVGVSVSTAAREALVEQEFWRYVSTVGSLATISYPGLSDTGATLAGAGTTLVRGAVTAANAPPGPFAAMRTAVQEALVGEAERSDAVRAALTEVAAQASATCTEVTGTPPDPARMTDRVDGAMAGYLDAAGKFTWDLVKDELS